MTTTRAGITIGAAYIAPPPRDPGTHAEQIQSALIAKHRKSRDALIAALARRIASALLAINDLDVFALYRWNRERNVSPIRSLCRAVRWGM